MATRTAAATLTLGLLIPGLLLSPAVVDAEETILGVLYGGGTAVEGTTLACSSVDGGHVAAIAQVAGGQCVVVDGKAGKTYKSIDAASLVLTPDGRRVAYVADPGNGTRMPVVDGGEGLQFDRLLQPPIFSPDGRRYAYAGVLAHVPTVVLDGREIMWGIDCGPGSLTFSPDGRRFAYATVDLEERWCVAVDGELSRGWAGVRDIVFGPDGERVAYAAREGPNWCVMVDDQKGRGYARVERPLFSPDGKHVAYVADWAQQSIVVVDGQAGPAYDAVSAACFSPDGRLIYAAQKGEKCCLVSDGKEGPWYDDLGSGGASFSGDGRRVAYRARRGEKWLTVVDGREGKEYDGADTVVFSPDGQRHACRVVAGGKWIVIVDGTEGPSWDDLGLRPPLFSPDGQRVAYVAYRGDQALLMVNSREGPQYYDILSRTVSLTDTEATYLALHSDGKLIRVRQSLGE